MQMNYEASEDSIINSYKVHVCIKTRNQKKERLPDRRLDIDYTVVRPTTTPVRAQNWAET